MKIDLICCIWDMTLRFTKKHKVGRTFTLGALSGVILGNFVEKFVVFSP